MLIGFEGDFEKCIKFPRSLANEYFPLSGVEIVEIWAY